jgi:hypothetical protein
MIGGTAACAAGLGFFVQMGEAMPEPVTEPVAKADFTPLGPTPVAATGPSALVPDDIGTRMAALDDALPDLTEISAEPAAPAIEEIVEANTAPEAPVEPVCTVTAGTETKAGAMVALRISAPCAPNARVAIHHNGLMFADTTDASGLLAIDVPALAVNAVFVIDLGEGAGAVGLAEVPSLAFYDRVALQWADNAGFEIHALEFGATYGEDGHVWQNAPRDVTAAALGDGGFLSLLGDADTLAPRLAQVYTFPSAAASREGTVALSVEAEVTEANCGRSIAAQALELRAGSPLRTRDLSLSVPGCEAAGSFLVLNNLMDDLKIAAR